MRTISAGFNDDGDRFDAQSCSEIGQGTTTYRPVDLFSDSFAGQEVHGDWVFTARVDTLGRATITFNLCYNVSYTDPGYSPQFGRNEARSNGLHIPAFSYDDGVYSLSDVYYDPFGKEVLVTITTTNIVFQ